MGDRTHVGDATIDAPGGKGLPCLASEAHKMAKGLLRKEHKGPGDTLEAAADRLAFRHGHFGLTAGIVMQAWNRPPRDMKVSRWMALFAAHWAEIGSKAEQDYEARRAVMAESHPVLVRVADFVAGRQANDPSDAR